MNIMNFSKAKDSAINKLMDEKEIINIIYDWAARITSKLNDLGKKFDINEQDFNWSSTEGNFKIMIPSPQNEKFMVGITFMVHRTSKATKKTPATWSFTIRDTQEVIFKNKDHIFNTDGEATEYFIKKVGE